MQKQMETTTKELEDKIYESSVGGGVVTAKVSGKKELMEIKLDPEVVDPDDIETLEDLIISAVNEAFRMQDEDYQENMNRFPAVWVLEAYRSNGYIWWRSKPSDRRAWQTSRYRSKDSTKTGILYHQYAGRTSTGTCRFNRKCKEEDSILQ